MVRVEMGNLDLLHGSTQTWREQRRIWPAAIGGLVSVAVVIAVLAVYGAFQRQQRIAEEERRQRQPAPAVTAPASPPVTASPPTTSPPTAPGPSRSR